MLETGICAEEMLVIGGVHIPFEGSGIDIVAQLFGERRFVWLNAVDAISAAAVLGSVVVLSGEFGVVGCLEERAEARGGRVE